MVAEEVIIALSGGAPWGFRLQGGMEHQKPLQVAKVRKRSKACRAGLREGDELVSINESTCGGLSHAQAMAIVDGSPGTLHIRVKRTPAGFQSVVLLPRAPSPRIDKEYRATLRAMSPPGASRSQQASVRQVHRGAFLSPTGTTGTSRSGLTSPPGSEAYYGETDSDADVVAQERQRRQKRSSPRISCPGKAGRASPEGGETSEMSGYDSAPDPSFCGLEMLPGVARREVIFQPPPPCTWSSQTSTETSSMSADDQSPREDSGFQELSAVPLVSPERAKGAMMLSSHRQLVPMVGPVDMPRDEELTVTYMDKAKQAKLNRGDNVQDKQVKEARVKCRTIASLLTDAPNPHSRGVLMFKKRRQRSKKYTLTSFGSVDEDLRQDSQEEEDGMFPGSESEFDEDGFSAAPDPTWDSDYLDMLEKRSAGVAAHAEDAQSAGLTGTSGKGAQLFEQQRKRGEEHAKKAAIAQAQTQVQAQPSPQLQAQPSPQLQAQPSPQLQGQPSPQLQGQMQMQMQSLMQPELQTQTVHSLTQPAHQPQPQISHMQVQPSPQPPPVAPKPQQYPREAPPPQQYPREAPPPQQYPREAAPLPQKPPTLPPAPVVDAQSLPMMTNGLTAPQGYVMSLAPEVAVAPAVTLPAGPAVSTLTAPTPTPLPEIPSSSVLNRTARPFAPGFISNRAATAPVVFRPAVAKRAPRPVSVAVVQHPFSAGDERNISAISFSTSMSAPFLAPAPSVVAPAPAPVPAVVPSAASVPLGPMNPPVYVVPAVPIPAPVPTFAPAPVPMSAPAPMSAPVPILAPAPIPASPQLARTSSSMENIQVPAPPVPMEPLAPVAAVTMATHVAPPAPAPVPVPAPAPAPVAAAATSFDLPVPTPTAAMHQSRLRATTAGGRSGFLEEARRRSAGRRMFHKPEDKKNSPNPTLLSMVQNLDDRPRHRYSDPVSYDYDYGEEDTDEARGKVPPPVAPKPRIIPEVTHIPQAEGRGAELFARRQSRMDQYVVDSPVSPTYPPQQAPQLYGSNARDQSPTQSLPPQWKYSPNVRAPPPIGYNPLHGPMFPHGASA
ncbi:synaptopodin 2-like protein [Clupea harengus]|uniref:Synaptopodin 2-like protein n=1 Tax=Clupea harengus TaxID=7950 RepID=A0A6P8GJN9_CLUHA|nr:synaptopodin 2-like protein [Clupea harengus]